MKRLKTFLIYGLLVLGLWILSDILIFVGINSTYQDKIYKILSEDNYEINISECRATYVNGYVKGTIKNNTENNLNEKYLKIDCYSQRDTLMGTKYVLVQNVLPDQSRDFEMYYKFENVEYCNISLVDKLEKNVTKDQFLSEEMSYRLIVSTLVYMCIM